MAEFVHSFRFSSASKMRAPWFSVLCASVVLVQTRLALTEKQRTGEAGKDVPLSKLWFLWLFLDYTFGFYGLRQRVGIVSKETGAASVGN